MDTPTQVLTQFVVASLLVERIVTVFGRIVMPIPKAALGKFLEDPDPWLSWKKWQILLAAALGLLICFIYDLDLFHRLLSSGSGNAVAPALGAGAASQSASSPPSTSSGHEFLLVGQVLTAIVIAGGSTGLQKILSSVSALAKANKAEAFRRVTNAAV